MSSGLLGLAGLVILNKIHEHQIHFNSLSFKSYFRNSKKEFKNYLAYKFTIFTLTLNETCLTLYQISYLTAEYDHRYDLYIMLIY